MDITEYNIDEATKQKHPILGLEPLTLIYEGSGGCNLILKSMYAHSPAKDGPQFDIDHNTID